MKGLLVVGFILCILPHIAALDVYTLPKEDTKDLLTKSNDDGGYYFTYLNLFIKLQDQGTQHDPETQYYVMAILDSLGYSPMLNSDLGAFHFSNFYSRFMNEYYAHGNGGFAYRGLGYDPYLEYTYFSLLFLDLLDLEYLLNVVDTNTLTRAENTVTYLNNITAQEEQYIFQKYWKYVCARIVNEISSTDVAISAKSLTDFITGDQSYGQGIRNPTDYGFTYHPSSSQSYIESTYYAVYILNELDPIKLSEYNSDIADFLANLQNKNTANLNVYGGFHDNIYENTPKLRSTYFALKTLDILTQNSYMYGEGDNAFLKIDKKAVVGYVLNYPLNRSSSSFIYNLYLKTLALSYVDDQIILTNLYANNYDANYIPTQIIGKTFNITITLHDAYLNPIEDAIVEMAYKDQVTYITRGVETSPGTYVLSVDTRFVRVGSYRFTISVYKDGFDSFVYSINELDSLSTRNFPRVTHFRVLDKATVSDQSIYPKNPTNKDTIKISLFLVDTNNAPLMGQNVILIITKPQTHTQNVVVSALMKEEANGFYSMEVSLDEGVYDVYLITETEHTTLTYHRTLTVKKDTTTVVTAEWFVMSMAVVGVFGTVQMYQNKSIIKKRVFDKQFWEKVGPSLISWIITISVTSLFIYLVGILAAIMVSGYMAFGLFTWWYCSNYREVVQSEIKDTLIKWSAVMLVMRAMIALLADPDQSFTGPMGPAPIGATPAIMYLSILWAIMLILVPAKSCSHFYDLIGRKRVPKAERIVSKLMGRDVK